MWRNMVLSITAGLLSASMLILFYPQPRIAVVHITGMISQFTQSETKQNHSPEQLKKRAQIFSTELEKTIKTIAKTDRLIIFPSEAVINGAIDITPRVQQQLQTALR